MMNSSNDHSTGARMCVCFLERLQRDERAIRGCEGLEDGRQAVSDVTVGR